MTTNDKLTYINDQIKNLQGEIWKLDTNAKALARAGLKERAEAIAKQSAECQQIIDAFLEQAKELQP